jgi:hypothetical protein
MGVGPGKGDLFKCMANPLRVQPAYPSLGRADAKEKGMQAFWP